VSTEDFDDDCARCGGHLPHFDTFGRRTCPFCGAASVAAPVPAPASNPDEAFYDVGGDEGVTSTGRGRSPVGCVALVIVVAMVGIVVVPVIMGILSLVGDGGGNPSGTAPPTPDVSGELALVLPGEPAAAADVIAVTSAYDTGVDAVVYRVGRLSTGTPQPRWLGPALVDSTYQVLLANDQTSVFYGDGAAVVALDLATGEQRWRHEVSDEITTTCGDGCLQVVGDQVIAISSDGVVVALDATTGSEVWQRRFVDLRGMAHLVGDRLVVIDRADADYEAIVLSPSDGSEVTRFQPVCASADGFGISTDLDPGDPVVPLADGSVVFGFGVRPVCWDRWNVGAGERRWQTVLDDASFARRPDVVHDEATLVAQGSGGGLLVIDLEQGASRTIDAGPDVTLLPAALGPDLILAYAQSTRGSRPWTLRGFDPATLDLRFERDLAGAEPAGLGPTSIMSAGAAAVAVEISGDAVLLVSLDGDTSTLTTITLAAADGSVRSTASAVASSDSFISSFSPQVWRTTRLVALVNGRLVEIDAITGAIAGDG